MANKWNGEMDIVDVLSKQSNNEDLEHIQRDPTCQQRETKGAEADLLGKVASKVRGVKDLIVEHREVERQAKPDGVGWSQICEGNILQHKKQHQ